MKKTTISLLRAATLGLAITTGSIYAADHGDAPNMAADQGADIADLYTFVDPVDPTKVVLIGTIHGFIVPSEANNFAIFDEDLRYSFHIENTGDSTPDMFIDVTFNQPQRPPDGSFLPGFKTTARTNQDAFIKFRGKVPTDLVGAKGNSFAPVMQTSLAGATPDLTTGVTALKNAKAESLGIEFFAGEVDDPFFFDIPGFNRFVFDATHNVANPQNELNRGRDSFAGYNILAIAIKIPAAKLLSQKNANAHSIGVSFSTARKTQHPVKGNEVGVGGYVQVDRIGVPGVNVVFMPYNQKNSHNGGTTIDDGKGKFYPFIVGTQAAPGTLLTLGTTGSNLTTLATVVGLPPVFPIPKGGAAGTGDYLRLDTAVAVSGFPNGRRPVDDVIDTVINLVTNGTITTGDHVNANDSTFLPAFPYLAPPHQPLENPTVDGTQN